MKTLILAVALQGLLVMVFRVEALPASPNIKLTQASPQPIDSCDCGRSTSTKVIGEKAVNGEFPWRVEIQCRKPLPGQSPQKACGGTIISPKWILTGADCLRFCDVVTVDGIGTVLANQSSQEVASFVVHKEYSSSNLDRQNDIGLVELKQDLDFSDPNIGPACLPYRLEGQTERTAEVVATGWGVNLGPTPKKHTLRKGTLNVIGNEKCKTINPKAVIDNRKICTQGSTSVCRDDTGGSLDEIIDGKYYAVGIISDSWNCFFKSRGEVHTRISEYTNWIEQNTGLSFCKK